MELEFDEEKRRLVLDNRGLDFNDCAALFEGFYFTNPDVRADYGEDRYISVGMINGVVVVVVWTPRRHRRRIITMRKANANERGRFQSALDRPG